MKPAAADLVEVEPGVFSILIDGAVFEARIDGDFIIVCGEKFPCEPQDRREPKRASGSEHSARESTIIARMPGKIVRLLARVDDMVEAGQGIVIVEAMKMQNELKAPRAGRVTAMRVEEGDSVNAGAILALLSH